MMHYDFYYANVGQGLFHYGEIHGLEYVYDCGGNINYLESAINRYIKKNRKKEIDLLIVSHFHDDHVNGLEKLINKVNGVNTVIIPYLSIKQRLFLSFQKGYSNTIIKDPALYFLKKGAKRVIYIKSDTEGSEFIPNDNNSEILPNDLPQINIEDVKFDNMIKDEGTEKTVRKLINNSKFESKVHVYTHHGHISIKGLWYFRFFNLKKDYLELKTFNTCLKKLKIDNTQSLTKALTNKTLRGKILSCYSGFKGNLNNTSLCLFHGPLVKNTNFQISRNITKKGNFISSFYPPFYPLKFWMNLPIGQILTGDISLKGKKFDEFEKHFNSVFIYTSLFLLPHHGAKSNWNEKIISKMPKRMIWIASCGFSNKYSHPHIDVIESIASPHTLFIKCDEFLKVNITN